MHCACLVPVTRRISFPSSSCTVMTAPAAIALSKFTSTLACVEFASKFCAMLCEPSATTVPPVITPSPE